MDRLTIDEAIQHCKEVGRDNREDAKYAIENELHDAVIKTCTKCAEEHEQLAEWLEELKEYKKLEEKGLLLKLPCKIGSTIYQLINSHIYEYKVIGICFDILHNKWMYEVAYEIGLEWFKTMCDFDVFGKSKTVFLTKEEAEKALKEMESAE